MSGTVFGEGEDIRGTVGVRQGEGVVGIGTFGNIVLCPWVLAQGRKVVNLTGVVQTFI